MIMAIIGDMAEMLIDKRVIFPRNKQRQFILLAKEKINISWGAMAEMLNVSSRTLTDWKREKFSIPLGAITALSKKSGIKIPYNIEIKEPFWYVHKGARLGGLARYKKYGSIGSSEKRIAQWRSWWEKEGRFRKNTINNTPLSFKKPKPSDKLSELVGIIIGDGGISKYQISITLHHKDDAEYMIFVINLIKDLFEVTPAVYHDAKDSVNNIVISRKNLVKFCVEKLDLKIGNKIRQQVDIPEWIKRNKKFQIACVRGLIDTDGSVIIHKYGVNGKLYNYKKLQFTSLSRPLLLSVYKILKDLEVNPRLARQKEVWIDSKMSVKKYFDIVGSHNLKHLNRYRN
ncbi:MAG: hypothetical protein A3A97_03680 [Candidatus Terrybacteria bacterium RIFCSPLOWO2_01_FULL_40_23]|uniref:DOD-type homing endonuclease domain-containing protein n=1 Tax=Candidatus Terrybacteria bacterium RIFCSPLOWO2_01_FULL_40_23 TaxID=1802366 RepID=A0A1G2PV72_9BACT|nr:MAG: hypothetical protein A3A97_03680 [Candidatus Terrybacteria bacterium RIFCSPLOWO2_01_FULL_40_23]